MQPDLLETDIAEGSYNLNRSQTTTITTKKLIHRRQPGGQNLSFTFSLENLDSCQQRCQCTSCHRRCRYFCSRCRIPLPCTPLPHLRLPIRIDVIKDHHELDSKSTALHAKLISPEDVCIYDYPTSPIPDYEDCQERVVLVFPSDDAPPFNAGTDQGRPIRAVFIDGTWKYARQLAKHPCLAKLKKVSLRLSKTSYWRYQTGEEDSNLATIEAIHSFLVEHHQSSLLKGYQGEYDDLLYLYTFFYQKIHQLHGSCAV